MSVPIKIGRGAFPRWCERIVPSRWNPGGLIDPDRESCGRCDGDRAWFSTHISGFSSGRTWKSTRPHRHPKTDELILRLYRDAKPVILDVGISDGITSLELIEKLAGRFTTYFATDRHLRINYQRRGRSVFFYDGTGECTVLSTKRFIVYRDDRAAAPFRYVARLLMSRAPAFDRTKAESLWLIQPDLRKAAEEDGAIVLREYDVFQAWPGPAVDIAKVANVLNQDYFSDDEIRSALVNVKGAIREGGRLFVTENRDDDRERASVFVKDDRGFVLEQMIMGGAEISSIVQSV